MGEFKTITTQEEFDAAIGERLKREKETMAKKYEGYISPEDFAEKEKAFSASIEELNGKLAKLTQDAEGHENIVSELNAKIKGYESDSVKTRIAHEVGLPYEMANRLSGDDEDAIRADAEALSKLMGVVKHEAPPLANRDASDRKGRGGETDEAYRAMLGSLEGGE